MLGRVRGGRGEGQVLSPPSAPGSGGCRRGAAGEGTAGAAAGKAGPCSCGTSGGLIGIDQPDEKKRCNRKTRRGSHVDSRPFAMKLNQWAKFARFGKIAIIF